MSRITWLRTALLLALGLVMCWSAQPVALASSPAAPEVESRVGHLKQRPTGYPTAGALKAQKLDTATVRQDLRARKVRATLTLRAVPSPETVSVLDVEFGRFEGSACVGAFDVSTPTYGALSAGFTRSGATITLDKAVNEAGYEDWNCAFVTTATPSGSTTYDVLGGALTDVLAKPKLKVPAVHLLGKKVATVGLVRNVWTTFEATVANTGHAPAPATKLIGSGRGVKVKTVRVGKLVDGSQILVRVRVKLTGNQRTKLKLHARSGKVRAGRTIVVRPVKAPKRPAAGKYRSKDKRITFRIRGGKVVRFQGKVQSRCGVWPNYTYPTNTWSFPKSSIPRNGIVDRVVTPKNHRLELRMRLSRSGAKQGRLYYLSDGGYCAGTTQFTAHRIRK